MTTNTVFKSTVLVLGFRQEFAVARVCCGKSLLWQEFAVARLLTAPPKLILNEPLVVIGLWLWFEATFLTSL
jgi:hypothetical protein